MKRETKNEILKIIDKVDDPVIDKEVTEATLADPIFELKNTLCDFFKNRLKKIEEQEEFKVLVQNALIKKIDTEEISTSQLIGLFRVIFNETTLATDSLLSVFKPAQGGISPLLIREEGSEDRTQGDIKRMFENLSQEDNQKLDKLMRVVMAITNKEKEEESD